MSIQMQYPIALEEATDLELPAVPSSETTPFDLRVVESGKLVLARLDGPLDYAHAEEVRGRLEPFCHKARRVVIDLRRAQYLDSTGVRTLLQLQQAAEAHEAELRLVVCSGSHVYRTLSLLHLEERFAIYDSVSDAWIRRAA